MTERDMLIAGLGLAAGVLVFLVIKGGVFNAGQTIGSTAVDAVTGVASGVVLGVGDSFGIPRTNPTQCERDIAAGRTWDASFSCPAGTFIKSIFN
jgi:hypothetical protein